MGHRSRLRPALINSPRRVGARSFRIPPLKIGTYDKLVQLSDDIEKVSSTVESTTARLYKQLLDSKCVSSHRLEKKRAADRTLSSPPARHAPPPGASIAVAAADGEGTTIGWVRGGSVGALADTRGD